MKFRKKTKQRAFLLRMNGTANVTLIPLLSLMSYLVEMIEDDRREGEKIEKFEEKFKNANLDLIL